ncbi:hypothetical protein [Marinobacterium ramblicola]|uniref:hypothetical protein n=1 Tax=Marinobacterium ramblicola TaxID=2849041 RepID=UPI001C2D5384|nr:hypothetical protein [Marinobacterium ramblicola]
MLSPIHAPSVDIAAPVACSLIAKIYHKISGAPFIAWMRMLLIKNGSFEALAVNSV